jgi:hypothetical protein
MPFARATTVYDAPLAMRAEQMLDDSDRKILNLKQRVKTRDDDKDFDFTDYVAEPQPGGFIEEFYDSQRCFSPILVPGTSLLPTGLMGIVYLLWLGYLFIGIAIISDIFMEAIESITA